MAAGGLKPRVVALLVFCVGLGLTALCLAWWVPPAWRIAAGPAATLLATKPAAA